MKTETIKVTYNPETKMLREVCNICNNSGVAVVMRIQTKAVARCCQNFEPDGSCCNYPIPDYEQYPEPCQEMCECNRPDYLRSFPLPDEAEESFTEEDMRGSYGCAFADALIIQEDSNPDILLNKYNEHMERVRNIKNYLKKSRPAAKEKYKFSEQDLYGLLDWLTKNHSTNLQWTNVRLVEEYIKSLHQFKPGIIYNAEITDGIITKIEQA